MFVNCVSLHMPQFKFAKNFVGDRRLSMRPENLEMNMFLKNNLRAHNWEGVRRPRFLTIGPTAGCHGHGQKIF